jgi:enterochelin esterase-like enzyme
MPRPSLASSLLLAGLCLALTACSAFGGRPPAAVVAAAGDPTAAPTLTPAPSATATLTPLPSATATATASPTPLPPTRTSTPTPVPTATPCGEQHGVVNAVKIPSPTLRYAIDARVYLPPCYTANQERYPVLYLLHGLSFTETQWVRLGAPLAADELIAAGEIAPLIIVMPRDRLDDRLDTAFAADLVPYVDATYRTLPDRLHRAIGGLSRGGGWSVHLGLHYPQLFGRIGAHSVALFVGEENRLLQWLRAAMKAEIAPAFYVDIGEGDGQRQGAFWLSQVLSSVGLEYTYQVQPGGHTEKYWSAHVADYLRFYAAGWRLMPTPTPVPTKAG